MTDLNSLIRTIARQEIKAAQPLCRERAVVTSVEEGHLRASVRFLSGSTAELLNKSGEKLTVGDSVYVEYLTLPSQGYIAMRNGEADPLGGGAGLYIENAAILTQAQAATMLEQQEIINVDMTQHTTAVYGYPEDHIVVSGIPVMAPRSGYVDDIIAYLNANADVSDIITQAEFSSLSAISSADPTPKSIRVQVLMNSAGAYGAGTTFRRTYSPKIFLYDLTSGTVSGAQEQYLEIPDSDRLVAFGVIPYTTNLSELTSYTKDGATVSTPYGYASVTFANASAYTSGSDIIITTGIDSRHQPSYIIPLASQAEHDYAFAVQTRSEVVPLG